MLAPDTTHQPGLYERTSWLSAEMLRLARSFAITAEKLEIARHKKRPRSFRWAARDLQTFTDQAAQLTGSLQVAIENENQRRNKS